MSSNNKLVTAIVVIHMLCNLLIGAYLIVFQLDSIKQRQAATDQRTELKKQNDLIVCILQTPPSERTDSTVKECREAHVEE